MLHPQKHKNLTEVNGESSFFFALYAIKTKIAQDQSTTPEVLLDVPNINGYKKWWSYGHPKILRKKSREILGTCGNQYPTGTYQMSIWAGEIPIFFVLKATQHAQSTPLLLF